MGATVVSPVPGQPGPAVAVRPGLQPGELLAAAGAAPAGADLVADDAAREADQDRGQGRPPREGPHVPDGRGGGAPEVVCVDPGSYRVSATRPRDGLRARGGVESRCGGNRDGDSPSRRSESWRREGSSAIAASVGRDSMRDWPELPCVA